MYVYKTMKGLEVYVLCLCIFVAAAELVGPEGEKKDVKDKVVGEEESVEDADTDPAAEQDYVKQLTDAVNKEIVTLHEYAEAIRKNKELPKEDEMNNGRYQHITLLKIGDICIERWLKMVSDCK